MSKLKDVCLIRALLLVGALAAANMLLGLREGSLAAQGETIPPSHSKCVFQGTPGAFCEYYPGFDCIYTSCVATALEP